MTQLPTPSTRFQFDVAPHVAVVQLGPDFDPPAAPHPAEEALIHARATPSRVRDFRIGRHAAHQALSRLGLGGGPIMRGPNHEPVWPAGVVGSITHARGWAIAAVAERRHSSGIGVDLEVRSRWFPGLSQQVLRESERARIEAKPAVRRVDATLEVFAAKEAIYKALFPRVQEYFGFEAVELEPDPDHSLLVGRIVSPAVAARVPAALLAVQLRWSNDAVAALLILSPTA